MGISDFGAASGLRKLAGLPGDGGRLGEGIDRRHVAELQRQIVALSSFGRKREADCDRAAHGIAKRKCRRFRVD